MYGGSIDVKDCFCRLRIRRSLPDYFALPPIRADAVGQRSATGWVWPCLSVLAMGFSWSFLLAQKINEAEVGRASALGGHCVANDSGGP